MDQGIAPPATGEDQRTPKQQSTGFGARLMRRKPVERLVAEGGQGEGGSLRRSLGMWQLTMISIGATLGTGIFVVLGQAVPQAGPAVIISFVLAGITALFSALSYAELAGSIPVSGSSYSYAYATLGELIAWVCGWCLILEYGVSVAAVAVGWGQYLNELLDGTIGVTIPAALANPPGVDGGIFNLPALLVVLLCMAFLLGGAKESARANTIMVGVKIVSLLLFCAVAYTGIRAGNYKPFMPLGLGGVSAAGATLFFSYIGFDAASTAGEEAKDPKRDLPKAIMLSLLIVTALYVLVAAIAVGAMPWGQFKDSEAALAGIMKDVTGQSFWAVLLAAGAVIAIASVVLTVLYGQTRILFAMSRDGLVPKTFAKVNPRNGVPRSNTVIVSLFCGILAAAIPLGQLADATSIGTLFAFALVNVAVMVLRRTRPGMRRTFRVPFGPLFPAIGLVMCVYMMGSLDVVTWEVFGGWMLVGLVIYFAYGMSRSKLATEGAELLEPVAVESADAGEPKAAAKVAVKAAAKGEAKAAEVKKAAEPKKTGEEPKKAAEPGKAAEPKKAAGSAKAGAKPAAKPRPARPGKNAKGRKKSKRRR
ncbi:APA family basic amino acid/polyamine antiporter [Streptomyces olivoverticillatus]|uniref:APA family basic amino acid/polyamine antiporter n=1 Tax=Streptomyces olivoverticillatus TaxID=66427 RepID=A0A7W7LRV7_9ACTN|nr:APA family basic amino acid/polyamine antiporter [Streptomyces olivoverticillatus]